MIFKLFLLLTFASAAVIVPSPGLRAVQCVPELTTRLQAERAPLPEYPEGAELKNNRGVVFVAVLFGTDGRKQKLKIYESPNEQFSEAVEKALDEWKLKELYDNSLQPIETRTGLRFHFVNENGQGRVEVATEQEQREFGGEWGKKVCKGSFDE